MARKLARDFDYGDSGGEDLAVSVGRTPVGTGRGGTAEQLRALEAERASLAAAPSESDPWAWQAWAATRNPEQNAWKTQEITTLDLPSIKPVLQQKGLWKPEYDVALTDPAYWDTRHETEQGMVGSEPTKSLDLSALKDYKVGSARSSGYNVLNAVLGPDGKPVGGFVSSQEGSGSLKAKDYAQIASLAATVFGGAAVPALGAAMGAGTGTLGTMAGAAALGAGTGALNASANDQDILSGALKGAAIGGIGAGAGSYIKGLDAASGLGITDPTVAGIVNKAVQGGATSALQTGLKGGDLGDVASSFGTGALTSGVGAGAGELLQGAGIDPRLANLAIQANKVYENPSAGGLLGLVQSGAGYFGAKGDATDVLGDKYPELGDRQPFPVYENIDNSEFQPVEPISLPEIPEMAQLNGVATEPSGSPYGFPDFTTTPSPPPSKADLEYFLSTNIPYDPNEPDTVQDLMAQYYPEATQTPTPEPVNPFADLPPEEAGEVVPIVGQRTGVYDYDVGTGDMSFPDPYGPDSGWGKDVLTPGYAEPTPTPAPAPSVSVPAPSIKIPGVGGAPSPAPATKAKSGPDMAGILALLGSMGGGQQAAPDNYRVADVRNATMNEMLRSMGLSA